MLKGGHDMKNLFQHVGNVSGKDTFEESVKKIDNGLQARTNKVVQRNMLLSNFPQSANSFERWSQEISNAARLISYDNYDWKQAAVDVDVDAVDVDPANIVSKASRTSPSRKHNI